MDRPNRKQVAWLVLGLALGLLFMGQLRLAGIHQGALTPLAGYATPGYILITVLFTVLLVRKGLPLNKLGFGIRPDLRQIMLVIAAIAILRLFAVAINPLMEELLGGARNLERFSEVEGSTASLMALLFTNWTFAAFGEELAYRIVLMRGISFVLGDSRTGQIVALVLQAVMFGLVHAYQGPAGIAGSTISGLVFGAVTIAGRRSIWPAAFAHGTNNTFGIIELYLG
ncbi:CPBP family intramembrane glutamic endopeptidase [Candidatus Neomarinimicrobiota bacterium]